MINKHLLEIKELNININTALGQKASIDGGLNSSAQMMGHTLVKNDYKKGEDGEIDNTRGLDNK